MKTFFDANVLLEILLPERSNPERAIQALRSATVHIISPLTVHIYAYLGQKQGFDLGRLLDDVSNYLVSDMTSIEVAWAINNCQDNDFEDALQVASAVTSDAQTFVTFDKRLAEQYQKFIDITLL